MGRRLIVVGIQLFMVALACGQDVEKLKKSEVISGDSARGGGDEVARLFIGRARGLGVRLRELMILAKLMGEEIDALLTDEDLPKFREAVQKTIVASTDERPRDQAGFEVDASVVSDPLKADRKMIILHRPFWLDRLVDLKRQSVEQLLETDFLMIHEYFRIMGKDLEENTFQVVTELERVILEQRSIVTVGSRVFYFGPQIVSYNDALDFCNERTKAYPGFELAGKGVLLFNRSSLRKLIAEEQAQLEYWSKELITEVGYGLVGREDAELITLRDESKPRQVLAKASNDYTNKRREYAATVCVVYINQRQKLPSTDDEVVGARMKGVK